MEVREGAMPTKTNESLGGKAIGGKEEMEEPLLPDRKEKTWGITWNSFMEELKRVSYMAAPMVAVSVSLCVAGRIHDDGGTSR